jgi:peptidoglycan/xylan/chitin deacetylase (PgdA/CDA1 family)
MRKGGKNLKRKYILAIFFIAIAISFCGSAAAADTSPTTVSDQVTTSSVQDNPTLDTPSTCSTLSNTQDTQSDTNTQTTVNDQATSTTPTTTASTQNTVQDTQSNTNPQTTQNVVSSEDPVVMTFDDGFKSVYTTAFPIMQQYGIKGTVYVVPTWVGTPGYMTLAELTALHNAGWTIASHSWDHTDLTTLTNLQITDELQSTMTWLNNNGFADGAYQLAYPYGSYNDNVLQIVSTLGIKTARTVTWGTIDPDGTIFPYETQLNYLALPTLLIRSDTTTTAWQSDFDRSIEHKGTSIFLMHNIVPDVGSISMLEDITQDTFRTIVEYINQKGIKTLTISQWYNSNFDTTLPTAVADLPVGTYNALKSVTITATDTQDTNPLIYYSTDGITWYNQAKTVTINLIQGITTLKFYAMDNAGNTCTTQTNTYTIDTTLPTATDNLPSGIFNTLKSVTLTAADNMDSNPLIYYSNDGITWNNQAKTVTLNLNEGITTLLYYAMDSAGNQCTPQTRTYTINTKMPIVTVDLPVGTYNTLKSVTLTAADNLDTNPLIYYCTDGLTWKNQAKTVTLNLNEGITTLMYYAENSASNKCPTQTNTYTIDVTKPTASANLNSGLYNTDKLVTLSMSEPGSIYYSLNGGTPSTLYTSPIYISWTCNLKYNAVDMANNPSPTYSQMYTIDKIAPKVSKTSPTNRKTSVSRTSYIYIKFSENFKKSTYWSKIRVKNLKTGKYLSISKYSSGSLLKIKTSKRSANRWYQVIIPLAAIQDYAGNKQKTTYTFKFKTRG